MKWVSADLDEEEQKLESFGQIATSELVCGGSNITNLKKQKYVKRSRTPQQCVGSVICDEAQSHNSREFV